MSVLLLSALLCLEHAVPSALAGEAPLPAAWEADILDGAPPPNVVFLLDLSTGMDADCDGMSCLERVKAGLADLIRHDTRTRYGVVGTSSHADDDGYVSIAPLNTSREELALAVEGITGSGTDVRNFGEALAALSLDAMVLDASRADLDAPFCAGCQLTHVITITSGLPTHDDNPAVWGTPTWGGDVRCDANGATSLYTDTGCLYDNVVEFVDAFDHDSSIDGVQGVGVSTLAINRSYDSSEVFSNLLISAARTQIVDGWAAFTDAPEWTVWGLQTLLELLHLRRGVTSAPVLEFDPQIMLHSSYELGAGPMARGHLRAYPVELDPNDADLWGRPDFDPTRSDAGQLWDAGALLATRSVSAGELNGGDVDGYGRRDIYTWLPEFAVLPELRVAAQQSGRLPFDRRLVSAVTSHPELLELLFPEATGDVDDPGDLNWDGVVNAADFQALINFTRGVSSTGYKHLGWGRGTWRLGDAPRARPAIVRAGLGRYSGDDSYRRFLRNLTLSGAPDLVLLAANDGTLHAFDLETGTERWAWVPGSLLTHDRVTSWSNTLLDLMVYGRAPLFEGTPTVEDIWVDLDDDGERDCDANSCEWRRVVVVSQGRGGPATLALDITDPLSPRFLWEHEAVEDHGAGGYTLGAPIVTLLEAVDSDSIEDRWMALWPTGLPVSSAMDPDARASVEPSLMLRELTDTYLGAPVYRAQILPATVDPQGLPAPVSGDDLDGDGRVEGAHVAGAPAVIDLDNDGDADVAYVVVHHDETREGGLWKVILDGYAPEASTWCQLADLTPSLGEVPEMDFGPTVSWLNDTSLAVYFATGSALTPGDGPGAIFALQDSQPWACAQPTPICGTDGALLLDDGVALTDVPLVWGGVAYFSTWQPDDAMCGEGDGRIYALRYDDCSAAGAPDAMGQAEEFFTTAAHPSSLRVSAQGAVVYAMPPGDGDIPVTVGTLVQPGVTARTRSMGVK